MKYVSPLLALLLASTTTNARQPDDDIIAAAKAMVERKLRDPSSAQYRDLHVVPTHQGDQVVCGEVNGKNAYGGYVGFAPFAVLGDSVILASDVDDGIRDLQLRLVGHMCAPKQTPPPS